MKFILILQSLQGYAGLLKGLSKEEKEATITEAIKDVFDLVDLGIEPPTRAELINFLKVFKVFVKYEPIQKPVLCSEAIDSLLTWIQTNPGCVFTGVNLDLYTFQLALRLRKPEIIDQDQKNLCGQVAMCYSYAAEDPKGFALFGMTLVSTGTGLLRQAQITASNFVKTTAPPVTMPVVDYVLLSSIRCALGRTGILEVALESTQPSLLAAWLRKMGYHNVEEHLLQMKPIKSFDDVDAIMTGRVVGMLQSGQKTVPGSKVKYLEDPGKRQEQLTCMNLARTKLTGGHIVLMVIDDSLEDILAGKKPAVMMAKQAIELHWVILTEMEVGGFQVKVSFVSHGKVFAGTVDAGVFCTRFSGFVSGNPA
jgi:hypothetical protein